MSLKLIDLLEDWYDPPEYDEPSGESFVNSDFDDVKLLFSYVDNDPTSGIFFVKHKETGLLYLSHTDTIDFDMYTADTYSVQDYDEDGPYSYEEIDEDSAELTSESMCLAATIMFQDGYVAKDIDGWYEGKLIQYGKEILRGFYVNEKNLFESVIKLIHRRPKKRRK